MAQRNRSDRDDLFVFGDEDLNDEAADLIDRLIRDDEIAVAVAGFDFETKVIAVTDRRVIIASGNEGLLLNLPHDDINVIRRDGRTLVIRSKSGDEHRHRFGKDDTVQELVETVLREKYPRESQAAGAGSPTRRPSAQGERRSNDDYTPIAEKVKFWEEQDRINQELIPRVIRQHELLTQHLSDHEMLPVVAAAAAREAVAQAQAETQRQLEEAQALNQELASQLKQSRTEREEQKKQHQEELSKLRLENRTQKIIATAAGAAAVAAIIIAIVL